MRLYAGMVQNKENVFKNRRLCVCLCWGAYSWLILFYSTLFLLVLIFKHNQEYNTNLDTRFIGCWTPAWKMGHFIFNNTFDYMDVWPLANRNTHTHTHPSIVLSSLFSIQTQVVCSEGLGGERGRSNLKRTRVCIFFCKWKRMKWVDGWIAIPSLLSATHSWHECPVSLRRFFLNMGPEVSPKGNCLCVLCHWGFQQWALGFTLHSVPVVKLHYFESESEIATYFYSLTNIY